MTWYTVRLPLATERATARRYVWLKEPTAAQGSSLRGLATSRRFGIRRQIQLATYLVLAATKVLYSSSTALTEETRIQPEYSGKYSYTDHDYRNVSGDIGQKDKYTPSVEPEQG